MIIKANFLQRFIGVLVITFIAISSKCQSVYISFTDSTKVAYNLTDVRNISFTGDVMKLTKTDGTIASWNISTIDYFNYQQYSLDIKEIDNTQDLTIYPNPSFSNLNIVYYLRCACGVTISIHDIKGEELNKFLFDDEAEGIHRFQLPRGNMPSGSYIISVVANNSCFSKTVVME